MFRLDGVFRSPWSEAQQSEGAQSSGLPVLTVHQNPAVSHSATVYMQTIIFNAITQHAFFSGITLNDHAIIHSSTIRHKRELKYTILASAKCTNV